MTEKHTLKFDIYFGVSYEELGEWMKDNQYGEVVNFDESSEMGGNPRLGMEFSDIVEFIMFVRRYCEGDEIAMYDMLTQYLMNVDCEQKFPE